MGKKPQKKAAKRGQEKPANNTPLVSRKAYNINNVVNASSSPAHFQSAFLLGLALII
jgi:hypothetical protein